MLRYLGCFSEEACEQRVEDDEKDRRSMEEQGTEQDVPEYGGSLACLYESIGAREALGTDRQQMEDERGSREP